MSLDEPPSFSYRGNRNIAGKPVGLGGWSSSLPHSAFYRSHEPFQIVTGRVKDGQSPELTPSGVSGARSGKGVS